MNTLNLSNLAKRSNKALTPFAISVIFMTLSSSNTLAVNVTSSSIQSGYNSPIQLHYNASNSSIQPQYNSPIRSNQNTLINLKTIALIESSNNTKAIGDNGKAIGLYQLHVEPMVDFNHAHGTCYQHKDAFNPAISNAIASWYLNKRIPQLLRHYHVKINRDNVLTAYNKGCGALLKGIRATQYIIKYKKLNKQ